MNRGYILGLLVAFAITGCASKEQILISTYSPPKESKKVEGMLSASESANGKYLAFAINPEVKGSEGNMASLLIDSVKERLTETNFIYIHPLYDYSKIALNMKVNNFSYEKKGQDLTASLSVSFSIVKGLSEFYTVVYDKSDTRFSKSGQGLPSRESMMIELSKSVAEKFVKDISPLKTNTLGELLELPDEIGYANQYALQKNYEGAIEAISEFSGEKDYKTYYNLAIFYEALAGEKEDFRLLQKANKSYKKAFALGGRDDEVVFKAKSRFDKLYKLFQKIDEQNRANQSYGQELEENLGF
jgi:hypothetical protein